MFLELKKEQKKRLFDLNEEGYLFNWCLNSSPTSQTIAKIVNDEIAGLIEFERQPHNLLNFIHLIEVAKKYRGKAIAGKLLAFVGKDALAQGFDGFMLLESKTSTYKLYQLKYGAKPVRGMFLQFDTNATLALIEKYLGGGDDEPVEL